MWRWHLKRIHTPHASKGGKQMEPLVSCIIPACSSRRFVGQSVSYFLRQDYPAKELIIIDDGRESLADLIPHHSSIQYIRLDTPRPLGAKRNLACEIARGGLIAHWSDTAWIAPDRLSRQVTTLQTARAKVCGAAELLHYHPTAGQAWLYRHQNPGPWLADSTLLYDRAIWNRHPFVSEDDTENSPFVRQLPLGDLHAIDDASFTIALLHNSYAVDRLARDPRWQQRPVNDVSRLFGSDRDFYLMLRHGQLPTPAPAPTVHQSMLTVVASFDVASGYGSMAEYLVLSMARSGARINALPINLSQDGLSDPLRQLLSQSTRESGPNVLYFHWISASVQRFQMAERLFINTMWESDRLPHNWVGPLNRARLVIVPTRFVAQVCRASGVTAPLEVIPEGIDPAVYHYQERPRRAGLTTLIVGPVDRRKHTLEGIAAWKQAFAGDPEARLIIKTSYNYQNYAPDDPRITYVDRPERTRGIAHYYQQADVLLALGNEGFGLPMVEAMATGLPVIALNSEGQSDVFQDAPKLLLPVQPESWQTAKSYDGQSYGRQGVPGVAEISAQLRWVATHRDEAAEMGRAASAWALEHRNIWHKGPAVLAAIERAAPGAGPLRRVTTFWTPSWGDPCGVAEYTAELMKAHPSSAVTRAPFDLQRVRLLHIQHEYSLFREEALARSIQQARRARVPVVITEHTVLGQSHAWEQEADALIALTRAGRDVLRKRWPNKEVAFIPPGCSAWFAPRKQKRGKVIGAFGFLGRHKGFWHILDVLRSVPDTELLLLSYARSRDDEAQWRQASAELPVRWVNQYLSTAEIMRRLAAEADILVFWYDQVSQASASAAVRLGLASGVPVLASPTRWFDDLATAVYQPDNLVEGVQRLLEDTSLREQVVAGAAEYCHEHTWEAIAERHRELWRALQGA
jgi:glycosyltransferase involved in cell wall biosynthesis